MCGSRVGVGASMTVVDLGERRRVPGRDGGTGVLMGMLRLFLLDGVLKPIQTIKTVTRGNIRSSNILPPDHGGVLLDGCFQQPLQDGPFPHGGGEVLSLSGQGTSGQGCFFPPSCGPPSSSSSPDRPVALQESGSKPPSCSQSPLFLTWALRTLISGLRPRGSVRVTLFSRAGPTVTPLPSCLRRGAKLIASPLFLLSSPLLSLPPLSLSLFPSPSPPHHHLPPSLCSDACPPPAAPLRSANSICYISPHDSHDLLLLPLHSPPCFSLRCPRPPPLPPPSPPLSLAFVLHPTPRALRVLYLPSVLRCSVSSPHCEGSFAFAAPSLPST